MSRHSSTPDSQLKQHIRHDAQQSIPPQGTSNMPVERFFTASQAWIQQVSSQNLSNNTVLPEKNIPELPDLPKAPPRSFLTPLQDS